MNRYVNLQAFYYDAVLWAVKEGLVNGMGGNRFDLYSTLAYDQMMALMCRAAGGDAGGHHQRPGAAGERAGPEQLRPVLHPAG